jgi:hypothetical protein
MKNGLYFLVDVDPEFSSILYRPNWPLASAGSVEGYAFWGIGPVVDNNMGLPPNFWALVGAYDGSESDESDYLLAYPFLIFEEAAECYEVLVEGGQPYHGSIPLRLQVVLDKGNATINLMEEEP